MKKKLRKIRMRRKEVFDSGLNIVKPVVLVPRTINMVVNSIQKTIGNNEFSILLKGGWSDDGFTIIEDYYIPEQEVSSTSVDYKEDLSTLSKEWNSIYHSHPFCYTEPSFSTADIESINSHFECSLLGTTEGIKIANISFFVGTCIVQVKADVVIYDDDIEIDTSKIKTKTSIYANYYTNYNWTNYKDDYKGRFTDGGD